MDITELLRIADRFTGQDEQSRVIRQAADALRALVDPASLEIPEHERRLDAMFHEAFQANDPPMLDYALLKMDLKRLRILGRPGHRVGWVVAWDKYDLQFSPDEAEARRLAKELDENGMPVIVLPVYSYFPTHT